MEVTHVLKVVVLNPSTVYWMDIFHTEFNIIYLFIALCLQIPISTTLKFYIIIIEC